MPISHGGHDDTDFQFGTQVKTAARNCWTPRPRPSQDRF